MEFTLPFHRFGPTPENLSRLNADQEVAATLLTAWLRELSAIVLECSHGRDSSVSPDELRPAMKLLCRWAETTGFCTPESVQEAFDKAAEFRRLRIVERVSSEDWLPASQRFWKANGALAEPIRPYLRSHERSELTQFQILSDEIVTMAFAVESAISLTYRREPARIALGKAHVECAELLAERDEAVGSRLKTWADEIIPRLERIRLFEGLVTINSLSPQPREWGDFCAENWHSLTVLVIRQAVSELRHWYSSGGNFPDSLIATEEHLPKLIKHLKQERREVVTSAETRDANGTPAITIEPDDECERVAAKLREVGVQLLPVRLVRFMWRREEMEESGLVPEVWSDHPTDDAIKAAVRKANGGLAKIRNSRTLSRSNGNLSWS